MAGPRFGPPHPYQEQYYQEYPHPANMAPEDAEYQSDFVVLGSRSEDSRPQECDVYLKVTELPESVSEPELKKFFQNRRESGGGPVASISLNTASKSAAVFFQDIDDVERVIQRAPLLLKGKKIHVESASMDQEEIEIKTVEVRGLQSEEDSEMCTYYFENPAKGGGDIEKSEWKEEEKVFLITFVDAEVAQSVASKGHKLGSKVLEVSLYTPPADEDDLPQCTILVRGFDPDKRDLYEMYFSTPRRGGDTIVDLRISEDQTAMYITFETPEVAERIAGKTHKVGGRQLEVSMAPVEQFTPPSTIIVTECDLTTPELYRFYFENPRRGGGDISDFVVDEKQKAILITFSDPEVAQNVVSMPHKVKNTQLHVAMYVAPPPSPKRQLSQEPKDQGRGEGEHKEEEEEEEAPPRMVKVTVGPQQKLESEDTYQLYFESRRHGGGDVDDVEVDAEKRLVYVTFKDAAVAARVAGREHLYNHQKMDVSLYVPPKPRPMYPNKLLFKNVADSTSRDCLCMYLERVTRLEPQEVLYGDEVGTVLVTFDQEPDLAQTLQSCQKKPLEGRKLTVTKVSISNCLLVENLNSNTTADTVEFYFENKRSGGGPVERVDLVPGEKRCFIYFEDHTVLDGVLSRSHILDGNTLEVKRYLECLGQSGGSEDPTAFILPKPVTLDTIDRYKVAYLRQCKNAQATFLQQLKQNHAKGKFTGDSLVLECTLTPAVSGGRILARTWAVDMRQMVESFLTMLEVLRREVMQEVWQEVQKAVSDANFTSPDGAILFMLTGETTFVVVGMKSMAQELFEKVVTTVKTVEEAIERRNQEVTEPNYKLKIYQLRLLLAMGFHTEAEKRHPDLKVEIQLKKNCIMFQGQMRSVKDAQVEMYEVLQPLQCDKMPKLSHMQKKLLDNKEVKPHIVQKFKKQNVVAIWELDLQNQVTVYAFSDKCLVDSIHIISRSVPEHVCELSPESVEVLQGTAWANLVDKLTKANPGILIITPVYDDFQVTITCIDSIMHSMVEEVEKFLQENCIYSQVVRFSPSRQLFVQQEWSQKLISLQNVLQAHKVQISMKEAGTELYVRGTSQGLAELRKRLEELNAQIVCYEERVTDVAKVKCLSSPHTDRDLKVLGQTNHCVVALKPEKGDLEVEQAGSTGKPGKIQQNMGSMQTTTSIQLPNGVTIAACQGDLTQMPVDVIVNAANNRMDHIGGLARDIVEKGGKTIQDESYKALKTKGRPLVEGDVLITGSGNLPCKAVVHAVGPVYRGGHGGEDDCLHDTILKCMNLVAEAGHSSLALPAISTGIYKYPPKEATRVITEAIKVYLELTRKSRIKTIYLCHLTADVVQMFADAIHRTFPHSMPVKSKPAQPPRSGSTLKGAMSSPSVSTGQKVISVSVIQGEIAKQSVDVIVNSTSNGLDLQNGAISGSILRTAGPGLQNECRQNYPSGINTGELAITSGHGLACKQVYHLALCNWHNPTAQQTLGSYVVKCLTEASKQHHQTIAFPVLGAGNLGYPPDIVAETMLGAIEEFQKMTPSTSLTNASIVIYHADKKILQVFQDTLKKKGGGGAVKASPPRPQPKPRPTGNRQSRRFAVPGESLPKAASGTSAVFEIGQLKLIIKQGDITDEQADAIVNSSNSRLDLSRGNVASALKAKCGDQLVKECAAKVSDLQKRGITTTKAYHLKSQIIMHINSERFSNNWMDAIRLCLEEAELNGVQTLAMPALGTGAYGHTASQSASALFHTLVKVIADGVLRNLQELKIVLYDLKMIPQFVGAIEDLGIKHANSSPGGLVSRLISAVTGSSTPSVKQTFVNPELKEATLYIYVASSAEIPRVLRAFDDLVKDRCVQKEVKDDVVLTLGPKEIEQIYALMKEFKVEISVQKARGQVQVNGLQNDVFEATQRISHILRQAERSRQELQAASMLANMVQWSFLEILPTGAKSVEYNQRENQIIELAFQNKKKNVELTDEDGNVYVVDFDSMMEYSITNPSDAVSVLRQDKIKEMGSGSLPQNWAAHSGSEHVKMVPIPSTDKEYQDVEANFRATLGKDRNVTITKISRVQNRTLYQQYAAKKAHLEKQNQGIQNERTLWHGTAADAIENINNYGFNRSYCGKNATVYGQGVYFAVNSHYSTHTTYSPPDLIGDRYIYQCKVLVGHAVTGNGNLRVLPAREGPILYDSATDNPKASNMFVIFNDTQAYPEYLVTFK